MSKNAAELLLELFDKWFSDDGSQIQAVCRESDVDSWLHESRMAARYLEEIELWIRREGNESRETKRVKRYIPKYWEWIFARKYAWNSDAARSRNYISQAEIDALDGLASKPVNYFGNLPISSVQGICNILPQLIEEIETDSDLSRPLKQYVKTVLVHVYNVLSVADRSSTFDQQNALSTLATALSMAGLNTRNEERKNKWQAVSLAAITLFGGGFVNAAGEDTYSMVIERSEQSMQELTSQYFDAESDDVVDEEPVQDEELPSVDSDE